MACQEFSKKIDGYNIDCKDFQAEGELMVTITLAEYRDLVAKNATASTRIDDANQKRWDVEKENKELRQELTNARTQISVLVEKFSAASEADNDASPQLYDLKEEEA